MVSSVQMTLFDITGCGCKPETLGLDSMLRTIRDKLSASGWKKKGYLVCVLELRTLHDQYVTLHDPQ